MKRYAVTHETKYTYGLPVELGLHSARLSPMESPRQRLSAHSIDVDPVPAWAVAFTDHFGNSMHHFAIETAHEALIVTQRTIVEVAAAGWAELPPSPNWESIGEMLKADGFPAYPDVAEFLYASPLAPLEFSATEYARGIFTPGAQVLTSAFELARRIKVDFAYSPGATTIATAVAEIMNERKGVCQDFAHAMISGLRGLGIPARYVSGYLKTYAPQSQSAALVGADATHAWVSVWCGPDLGWVEFDPTNALVVGDEHIAMAYGRDFTDVTPLRGVIMGGGAHSLSVAVQVDEIQDGSPSTL